MQAQFWRTPNSGADLGRSPSHIGPYNSLSRFTDTSDLHHVEPLFIMHSSIATSDLNLGIRE